MISANLIFTAALYLDFPSRLKFASGLLPSGM